MRTRLLMSELVLGLVLVSMLSWTHLWAPGADPWLGADLVAYANAAARLMATGNPYHPILLQGPIENIPANIPVGYLYAPPLAQMFVPLLGVPSDLLTVGWALGQAAAILVLLPLVFRHFGGTLTVPVVLAIWLVVALDYSVQRAVMSGNVSGWMTAAVALMLVAESRTSAAYAAAAAVVKLTCAPLVLPALASKGRRAAMVLTAGVLVGMSVALAPAAWAGWAAVLPNILRFPASPSVANYAPVAVLGGFGAPVLGQLLGYAVTGFAVVVSIVLGRRGRWPAAVAAATVATVFSGSTIWDHYTAVLVPVALAAWTRSGPLARAAIVALFISHVAGWLPLTPSLPYRFAYVGVLLTASAAVVIALARDVDWSRQRLNRAAASR